MFQDFDQGNGEQNTTQIPVQKVFEDNSNNQNDLNSEQQFISENESIHSMPDKFLVPGQAKKGPTNWVFVMIVVLMIIVVLGIAAFGVYFLVIKKAEEPNSLLNLEPNENATTTINTPAEDLSTPLLRDKKRIKDIEEIRSALSLYFSDNNKYPNTLSDLNKYIKEIPKNPSSDTEEYSYQLDVNNNKYKLIFSLEEGGVAGNLTLLSGRYQATPELIETFKDEPEEPVIPEEPVVPEEPVLPLTAPKGEDMDNDGLTDKEEDLFNTDKNKIDTDGDGYLDKEELLTLYDPTKSGEKLVNNVSIAKVYINEKQDYSIIYPGKWRYEEKNSDSSMVTFQESVGMDFFQIETRENPQRMTLKTWYQNMSPDSNPNDLENFSNKNDVFGVKSKDGFNLYIARDSKIYIVSYIVVNQDSLEYFSAFEVFLQAFKFIVK